jgi:hypothetical protein
MLLIVTIGSIDFDFVKSGFLDFLLILFDSICGILETYFFLLGTLPQAFETITIRILFMFILFLPIYNRVQFHLKWRALILRQLDSWKIYCDNLWIEIV